MASRVDIEEIESTKSEKLLAIVLTAFLLMGSIWIYVKVDAWVPGGPNYVQSSAEQKATQVQQKAWDTQATAEAEVKREESELGLAKNSFDIAAAKGDSAAAADAEAEYTKAEQEYRAAERRLLQAQQQTRSAEDAVRSFERSRQTMSHDGHNWAVAAIRLGFIVGWLLVAYRIIGRLRQRNSRFLPLGFAAVGTGVITAVVFATDYITDFIDPLELGPIVLSGIGTLATMGAFVGLQEWLERRLPGKRVRNSECPYCGHPVRPMADGNPAPFCEGCGHAVTEPCGACGSPRRVGAAHCPHCGDGGPEDAAT